MKEVLVRDDLSGQVNAQPRQFTIAGRTYEVDLCDENNERLEQALSEFIAVARDITPAPRTTFNPYSSVDQGAVRTWAQANGYEVSPKGRVSLELVNAYRAAQEQDDPDQLQLGGDDEFPTLTAV